MKKQILTIALLLTFGAMQVWSQNAKNINQSFTLDNNKELFLHLKFAKSIKIKTSSQNKVQIKVSVDINGGKDNERFELATEKLSDRFEIRSRIKDLSKITKTMIVLNNDGSNDFSYGNHITSVDKDGKYSVNSDFLFSNISYEITVPVNTKRLKIKTISGNIEMTNPKDCKLYAKSISGFIDVSLTSSQKANLEMRSFSGEVYSDLPIKTESKMGKSYRKIGGRARIKGALNGGGTDIYLKSFKGNIYLRKAK